MMASFYDEIEDAVRCLREDGNAVEILDVVAVKITLKVLALKKESPCLVSRLREEPFVVLQLVQFIVDAFEFL